MTRKRARRMHLWGSREESMARCHAVSVCMAFAMAAALLACPSAAVAAGDGQAIDGLRSTVIFYGSFEDPESGWGSGTWPGSGCE